MSEETVIKVGDKVTIKFDALAERGLRCVRDCTKGKAYVVSELAHLQRKDDDEWEDAVLFIDDVGDTVDIALSDVELA